MEADHIHSLTSDYALGLLPADEVRRVERHAGQCPACRDALRREQGVAALVRGTIHQAARPAPGRLGALRPAVVARSRPTPAYRRLAPLTVATLLVALGLLFGRGVSPFAPAVFAGNTPTLTVTNTQTPTATLAAVLPAATESSGEVRVVAPAAPIAQSPAPPRATPAP